MAGQSKIPPQKEMDGQPRDGAERLAPPLWPEPLSRFLGEEDVGTAQFTVPRSRYHEAIGLWASVANRHRDPLQWTSGVVMQDKSGVFVRGLMYRESFSDNNHPPRVFHHYPKEEDELVIRASSNFATDHYRDWHDFYGDNWPRRRATG